MRDPGEQGKDTHGEVCGVREEDGPVAVDPLVETRHGALGGLCGKVGGNVAQTEHLQVGNNSKSGTLLV